MYYKTKNQKREKIFNIVSLNKNDANEIHKNEYQKNEGQIKNTNFPQKNNSLQDDKMEIDDLQDDNIVDFQNKLEQAINSKKVLETDIPKLLKETYNLINKIQKKANESNSISTKLYFDKEIKNLLFKAKELEKSSNHNNISSQKTIDSSGDILEVDHKHKYMGNKERQNSDKFILNQEKLFETTGYTSKNHVLINAENKQITKKLELNNQIVYNKNYDDLIIRVINTSIDNICKFINERAKSKYNLDLNYIYVKKIDEINITNYEQYLESTINDIYLGKFLQLNSTEKDKIKTWVISLLDIEKQNVKEKVKILNKLFSKNLKEILLLYINDDPYLQVKNNYNKKFNLKRFNTFSDDFNEYNKNEKIKIKEYINSLLDNIIIYISNEENNE